MGSEEAGRHVSFLVLTVWNERFSGEKRVLISLDVMTNSSDADSDVLADYVLALIRADTPDEDLKKNAVENLEDFLRDSMSFSLSHALVTSS